MIQTNPSLRISVLGCGWLGLPLLTRLVQDGHQVAGSSRNLATLSAITAAGGEAFLLDLPQPPPTAFLDNTDLLIITLPPGGRQLGPDARKHYLAKLEALMPWLKQAVIPHVIFTSSTGVYGAATGEVTENHPLAPSTHSGQAVVAAEAWLQQQISALTILRLAGLIGPGRHPGKFFGGNGRPIRDGDAPVNLVMREDVIEAFRILIKKKLPENIFNVCANQHPAKGTYYSAAS
ncbi:MAG: NAD(P)H-binding protein, partial [Bacteroidota bacterium]